MRVTYTPILIAFTGLASLAASVDAAVVEGRLLAATFRGRVTRGVSMKTKILLGGGRYQTQIARDGTFEFPDVAVGTYILEVQSASGGDTFGGGGDAGEHWRSLLKPPACLTHAPYPQTTPKTHPLY
ncbi:hypothetical protein BGZ95_003161, partial [Linnemannia exigua]